jgi:hypothetical protein
MLKPELKAADHGGQNKMIGFTYPHQRHLEYIEMVSRWVIGGRQQ